MTRSAAPATLLEIIIQSVDDARAAAEGGADRLEVVRDIPLGGLTPSLSLVRAIAAETTLPLRVMVRENAGYGHGGAAEMAALQRHAAGFAALGVNGLVVGFAHDGQLLLEGLSQVLHAAAGVPATFHRAFDTLSDPLRAIDTLTAIPQIDAILTSGGEGGAEERCARLREYSARAGLRLRIVAGSRVDDAVLRAVVRTGCVREVHVGRAAREGGNPEGPVTAARVRRLREVIG